MVLPRPDLSSLLGVTYRRIPILAINNTVLADTHLILPVLESLFPAANPLCVSDPVETAKWERWADAAFPAAVGCIPAAALANAAFRRDREELTGRSFDVEMMAKGRAGALRGAEKVFADVEEVMGGGKKWILGGEDVALADVHGAFLLSFLPLELE